MSTLFDLLCLLSLSGLAVGLVRPSLVRMPSRKRVGLVFGVAAFLFAFLANPPGNIANGLFAILAVASFAALIVGLRNPSRVKMPSHKLVGSVFGGATILFLILFAITSPQIPQSPTTSSTGTTLATSAPSAIQAQTDIPLTPAQTQQADDAHYVSYFNNVVLLDFSAAGAPISAFGKDWNAGNYSAAISDLQSFQSALQTTQSDLQTDDQTYEPLSPNVEHINTLMDAAVTAGLKGASTSLTDLESGNLDGVENASLQDIDGTMFTDFTEAKAAAAGWQAQHPQ